MIKTEQVGYVNFNIAFILDSLIISQSLADVTCHSFPLSTSWVCVWWGCGQGHSFKHIQLLYLKIHFRKFSWNWLCGSRGVENVKNFFYRKQQTEDEKVLIRKAHLQNQIRQAKNLKTDRLHTCWGLETRVTELFIPSSFGLHNGHIQIFNPLVFFFLRTAIET